jgi:thioesterase domain-containing protein/acyl carrier protein
MMMQQIQSRSTAIEVAAETPLLRRSDLGLPTPWAAPRTETEIALADIWRQILNIDAIGAYDDFFDLGGDSFAATTLAAEIEAVFKMRFAPSDIINASTVEKQAQKVAENAVPLGQQLPSHLILGHDGGSQAPVFMVHGGFGFAFFRPDFLEEIGRDRPIYLFQAPGLDGRVDPLTSVEAFASLYVESIRRIQPTGPYHIVAMCAGSFIALEMCNQLNEAGEVVARLVLLDPPVAPPAIKQMLAEIKGKRIKTEGLRRSSSFSRIFSRLGGSNRPRKLGAERALKRGAKMQRIVEHIRSRVERMEPDSPEQAAYAVETRARVVEALKVALDEHVPRPYLGQAAMLVSSAKANKMVGDSAFWPNHLGGLEYEICDGDHQELFRAKLKVTARFVSRALADARSGGTQTEVANSD